MKDRKETDKISEEQKRGKLNNKDSHTSKERQ